MAIKTFEREVKKLSTEFTNLIENYNFEEYDFHSIRQTLQSYIEQTYPNYNDYFRSDYVMMLIELFAYYGEMMAYRMDTNLNEVYLSSAKERKSIIKIADMLGYKYARIEPSIAINRINLSDDHGGSMLISKIKKQNSTNDILSKKQNIDFVPVESIVPSYFQYKLDYLLNNVTTDDFMNTVKNIFIRLEDFNDTQHIKIRKVMDNNFEYYERSIFIDKFEMRFEANTNVYVDYANSTKTFEIQSLLFDTNMYFNSEDTLESLTYNHNTLYNDNVFLGFEFVLKYDKGHNIIDKNVYMYIPTVQGGTFTRPIDIPKPIKNFKTTIYEQHIFNNPTIIKQFDAQDNLIRTYYEVDNLNNHTHKFAYEINNTENGHIELLFGDGKNSEILLTAHKTLLYYRKNLHNSDEIMNIVNGKLQFINTPITYFDRHVGKTQSTSLDLEIVDSFNSYNGQEAESDEQIKYMARKLRSIQDRFVTGTDYETAGMLHPKVKYTSVVLRSYIGKNSPRMSNEFIDIYMDGNRSDISYHTIGNDHYIYTPNAYFTESSVKDMFDIIKFVDNDDEYFFEIFDVTAVPANDWYKYPAEFIDLKNKGTIIKILNKKVNSSLITPLLNINILNGILPMDYGIIESKIYTITPSTIYIDLQVHDIEFDTVYETIIKDKTNILTKLAISLNGIDIIDLTIVEKSPTLYSLVCLYNTSNITIPKNNISYIWTHYKSDDIYINPSKSNIIEIYVTGIKKDLKKHIESFSPLSTSEINNLVRNIDKRKMISDIVQVYNAGIYEIEIGLKVYKKSTSAITDELLKSKIDTKIDKFFDISNIPLGKHFHLSRLFEWLHSNIEEIEHIEVLKDNNNSITPSSTINILKDKIMFTQIVEKLQKIDNKYVPVRTIEIVS